MNSQNTANSVKDLSSMTTEELQLEMTKAISNNNFADIGKYAWELEKRKNGQNIIEDSNKAEELGKEMQEILNKKSVSKEEKEKIKKYIENDMKNYKETTNKWIENLKTYKENEVLDLKKQLNESLTNLPSLREYISLDRRRLANIKRKFEEYRGINDSNKKYPENVLMFCMWMTETKIFWIRQWIKRWWVKMFWGMKNEDIAKNLKIAEDKLKENPDDWWHTKLLKWLLRKELFDAKTKYLEKQKAKIFG